SRTAGKPVSRSERRSKAHARAGVVSLARGERSLLNEKRHPPGGVIASTELYVGGRTADVLDGFASDARLATPCIASCSVTVCTPVRNPISRISALYSSPASS